MHKIFLNALIGLSTLSLLQAHTILDIDTILKKPNITLHEKAQIKQIIEEKVSTGLQNDVDAIKALLKTHRDILRSKNMHVVSTEHLQYLYEKSGTLRTITNAAIIVSAILFCNACITLGIDLSIYNLCKNFDGSYNKSLITAMSNRNLNGIELAIRIRDIDALTSAIQLGSVNALLGAGVQFILKSTLNNRSLLIAKLKIIESLLRDLKQLAH